MNRDEAKNILLLYRPGQADDADPQLAEALALAKTDAGLASWFEQHCARQTALRAKFQAIAIPDGLKEQIISEQKAADRRNLLVKKSVFAVAALATVITILAVLRPSFQPADDTFAVYRSRMVSGALRGYSMDLATNDLAAIHGYLSRQKAPSDYELSEALQKTEVVGCAVQRWHDAKVTMLCFRTGKPLPPDQPSDLWLFVVDRTAVKAAPEAISAQLAAVNRLTTAVWTKGDKLYLLGTTRDEQTLRRYL